MADNVFRIDVGANIGRSTILLKQDINTIFKDINKYPTKIKMMLDRDATKQQIESDFEAMSKQMSPKVTVRLNGGGSLKSGSGQHIMQDINKITAAISRQQAAKITLHLDVAASQKAMMAELKKLNLGVQITPGNNGGNNSGKKKHPANSAYQELIRDASALKMDILRKKNRQSAISDTSEEFKLLKTQIDTTQQKYDALVQSFINKHGKALGITDQSAINHEIDSLRKIERLNEEIARKNKQRKDKANQQAGAGAKHAAEEAKEYERLLKVVGGSGKDASGFNKQLVALHNSLERGKISLREYHRQLGILKKEMSSKGFITEDPGQRFSRMVGNRVGYATIAAALLALRKGLRDIYTNVTSLDKAMTELKKVTDETDQSYRKFLESASQRAKSLGATLVDTVNATANFARLGYSLSESADLADAALVYKNVGDGIESIDEASESVIATMQAFGISASDAMLIVDKFNEVGNKFAISSKGVGDALLRSAAAMNAANNSLDETIALTAAANTVVQDPEKVGTVLKTLSMFLRAAKTDAEEAGVSTEGMANSVSELREEIKRLTGGAVDIQLDENTFKSTYQILKEISQVWDKLTDVSQANLLEMLGGKRNSNVVAALVENFDVATSALKESQGAAGSALKENEKYLDSINGKIDQMRASFEDLSSRILSNQVIKFLVDALRGVLELFNKIDAATNGVSTWVMNAVAAFVIARGVIVSFTEKVNDGSSIVSAFFGIFSKDGSKNALKNMIKLVRSFGDELYLLGVAVSDSKLRGILYWFNALSKGAKLLTAVGVAVAAVSAAIAAFDYFHHSLKEASDELEEAKQKVNELSSAYETNAARIKELQVLRKEGSISLVEQDELTKLERENSLLKQRLEIAKSIEAAKAGVVSSKASSELENYLKESYTYDSFTGAVIAESDYVVALNNMQKFKDAERQYQEEFLKGEDANQRKLKKYDDQRADALDALSSTYEKVAGYMEKVDASDSANAEILASGQQFLDQIDLAIGGASALGRVWENIWNDDKSYPAINNIRKHLQDAASASPELFDQTWQTYLDSGRLDPIIERLNALGISLDDGSISAEQLRAMFGDMAEESEDASSSIGNLSTSLDNLSNKYETINAAQEELSNSGFISAKTLSALAEKFPAARDAIDLYIIGLKSGKELLAELSSAYDADVLAQKSSIIAKLQNNEEFFSSLLSGQSTLISELSKSYGIDLKNYKSMEDAKEAYQKKIISQMAGNYSEYVGLSIEEMKIQLQNLRTMQYTASAEERVRNWTRMTDLATIIARMEKFEADLNKTASKGLDYQPELYKDQNKSKGEDKYKKFVEEEIAKLKHRFEMEEITAEEYYNGLESIENRYYKNSAANQEKYAAEIRSIDEELFQGRRDILSDWLNDQGILAEKAGQSGNIDIQKVIYQGMIDKVKSMIDDAYDYGLDASSDYIQELEKKITELQGNILDAIRGSYDDFISYMDDFDLWKGVDFSKFDVLKRQLKEVIALYEKGQLSWAEYVNARNEIAKELHDTRRDSLETILDMTMEMIKQEGQDQVDALDKQIDAYKEIIDLKKKLLQDTSDEKKHEQEVAELVKSISELQSKIAQLSLDDSREAAAKRAELEQQLHDKQKELAELQGDYALDQTLETLDKSQEAFEKEKEAEKDAVEDSIDSWQELYEKAIDRINRDWDGLYKDLMEYEMEHRDSIDGPNSLVTAWKNATSALKEYNNNFEAALEGTGKQDWINPNASDDPEAKKILEKMKANSEIAKQMGTSQVGGKNLHAENQALADEYYALTGRKLYYNNGWRLDSMNGEFAYQISSGNKNPSRPSEDKPQTSGGKAYAATIAEYGSPPEGTLRINSKGEEVEKLQYFLKQLGFFPYKVDGNFYQRTAEALMDFQRLAGIKPDGVYGPNTRAALPNYHTGGVVTDEGSIGNGEVLAVLKTGEWVLDERRKQNLKEMFAGLKNTVSALAANNISNRVAAMQPTPTTSIGGNTFAPNISVSIMHSGEMKDADAKRYGQEIADTALERLKNAFTKRGI